MVANLDTLFETVDLTRLDRKLADAIDRDLPSIKAEIERQGFSLVTVDGKTFRIERSAAQHVAGAA